MVPAYELTLRRAGVTVTLRVPFTLGSDVRRSRVVAFLTEEHWAVSGGAGVVAAVGAHTTAELLREELLFVRDCLGPLRRRQGVVPEKVAAKLLEVGVKGLHERCQELFGLTWAEFLLARLPDMPAAPPAPAPAAPPPPALHLPAFVPPALAAPPPPPPLLAPPPPLLAPAPAPPPPSPLSLPPGASLADGEEESLVDMLLGPACDSASADELHSLLTSTDFQLDMAAAVELEAATSTATPLPPAPRALVPTSSTATSPPSLGAFTLERGCPSPAASFLAELDATLADPLMLVTVTGPVWGAGVDELDLAGLELAPLPDSFPTLL